MTTKSLEKRKYILACAERVFIREGFNKVTMKDIIDECKISRGGLYLYFQSVDEIFMEVIREHNEKKLEAIQCDVKMGYDFHKLIDEFFDNQKERLLNMNKSLITATFEFYLSHKKDFNKEFFFKQFYTSKEIILQILKFGVKPEKILDSSIELLAENIMFFLEGISTLAMSSDMTGELIDAQFNFIKNMIYKNVSV